MMTTSDSTILLGYEIGTGARVDIPTRHMAVTGQTQESGKTTTLEALVARAGHLLCALTFVTKRGESAFQDGRRIQPYFRDRADWQFVDNLLSATLQEKNKFLRPWIMRICRQTHTLRQVWLKVREALATARGINEGVYTQLDAYLAMIVPEIERADLAPTLDLRSGLNVMDVSSFDTPMQMLFVQSALDWVNERMKGALVVIPEAWEFIPEGKGSPVKASAINLVRKGAGLRNFIWVDSQDMAGVDKVILRGCTVWLIGAQREANEIKRSLANIPQSIKRPTAADIATLAVGQFYACWGHHCVKTYVQPAWMASRDAERVAAGGLPPELFRPVRLAPRPTRPPPGGPDVNQAEAEALRQRNTDLEGRVADLTREIAELKKQRALMMPGDPALDRVAPLVQSAPAVGQALDADMLDTLLDEFVRRAKDRPDVIALLRSVPEIEVKVERRTATVDGSTPLGRVVMLLAQGFFDDGATNSGARTELRRTGADVNNANLARILSQLQRDGFLTLEGSNFRAVAGMKSNIRQTHD